MTFFTTSFMTISVRNVNFEEKKMISIIIIILQQQSGTCNFLDTFVVKQIGIKIGKTIIENSELD